MNINKIIELEKNYEVGLYPKRGIALQKGSGIYLFDTEGKRYIDCMTNIGVNILGYGNSSIANAIAYQISALPSCHQSFYSEQRAILLKEFTDILPSQLSKIIFTNSGAESIEAALKLARIATGKKKFIAATNSYHGKTFGALSVTGQEKYRLPFLPLLPEIIHVPFNDILAMEHVIDNETAAIIIEPIQGEGGILIPNGEYLKKLKALCERNNVLFIADEVQTAIRTGTWLACEQFDVVPDIVCLSKSFSYGLPFGVVVTTSSIANKMKKGGHGSTFAGNPTVCVTARQVIRYLKKENLLESARIVGTYFLEQLQSIKNSLIKKVRGAGLMIGLELFEEVTPYVKSMQNKGLLTIPTSHNTIRFLPPVTFTKEHVDEVVKIVKEVSK